MPNSSSIATQIVRVARTEAGVTAANDSRWYAVQCQPHRERTAAFNLARQDVPVFLPLIEKSRRHARRVETVLRPFFQGYLFVQLNLTQDCWSFINGTFGVLRLVMQGKRPASAPRGIIEELMDICGDNSAVDWRVDLKPGQSVKVLMGPFAELIGEIEAMSDAGRVRVLLDIMGGRTPVSLPRNYVVPAECCL
jgi:transcription elongation factor/antiterminator RfaH